MENVLSVLNLPIITAVSVFIIGTVYNIGEDVYTKNKEKKEFSNFRNMVRRDYIKPINSKIDIYTKGNKKELEDDIGKFMVRLKYLKEEEIIHMEKGKNKLKMVREIELSLSYLKVIGDHLKYYGYVSPDAEEGKKHKERDEKIVKEGLLRQKDEYLRVREDYVGLKKDYIEIIDLEEVKKDLKLS